jgi:hypothetical protein
LDSLKETVVRLTVHGRHMLPAVLPLPHVISQRVDAQRASAVVAQWSEQQHAQLGAALDADIEVESLGLEDIFVEFHG